MKVVHSDSYLLHAPLHEVEASGQQSPYENPRRIQSIVAALQADAACEFVAPTEWGTDPIIAVHNPGLLRFLSEAWELYTAQHPEVRDVVPDVFAMAGLRTGMSPGREPDAIGGRVGYWCFETTTPITRTTYQAARGAVDIAMSATALVLGGERASYGLCRPPGHHATRDLYGGYCFFNNAAIAAHHVAATTGTKVTVLDVDYHHGNGTQQIFYERDDVQYVSLHGDPVRAYPYTVGYADETGAGKGLGCNLNYPLPLRADDDLFVSTLGQACEQIAAFGPSMVIVSLGLDTFITDPICDLAVTTEGFRRCGDAVAQLGLPTVVLQEGGYDVDALGANVAAWLGGLSGR